MAFSPDGKTLATGASDRRVKLWNLTTRQELATLTIDIDWPLVNFSPDGRMLTIGDMTSRGTQDRRIQVIRAPSFEEIAAADAHPAGISSEPRQDTYDDLRRIPGGVAR